VNLDMFSLTICTSSPFSNWTAQISINVTSASDHGPFVSIDEVCFPKPLDINYQVGACRCEDRLLLEREDEVDGTDGDEDVRDRLGALGVGGRVRAALLDVEFAAEASRER